MRSLEDAQRSLARVTFTEDQRERSKTAWLAADEFLKVLWKTVGDIPSAELTLACRAVEEACMWHSKAVSNETKNGTRLQ